MSKAAGRVKSLKKAVQAAVHTTPLRVHIEAQLASSAPPLGSQLGQRGINIAAFCKDFNERTASVKKGVPIPCTISVKSDRSYDLAMTHPPFPHLVMQAAGIRRGAMQAPRERAGKITRKHVYEIARLKSEDPSLQEVDMRELCDRVVRAASLCGVQVVDRLDASEYASFLLDREKVVAEQRATLDEEREAKLLKSKA